MHHTPRRVLLRALAAAAVVVAVPGPTGSRPVPAATLATTTIAVAVPTDDALTARLHADADTARRSANRETLYTRGTYVSAANRIAQALAYGQTPPGTPDGSPLSRLSGISPADWYESQIDGAIDAVVSAAHNVLAYQLHTDGGWSVRSTRLADGRIRWGVALIVGWPDPATTSNTGCLSGSGYCWSTRGVNPHLPWTRNTVTWYLSTSNLPPNGESLMQSAIATLNRVSGLGADIVYGGRTSATTPNATNRFLIVWGSGCSSSSALACTMTGTQGSYNLIYQARVIMSRAKYNAYPTNNSLWIGTLIHEMGHGLGLGHFDGTYLSRYQLMRWANGPNALQAGDLNGVRRIAPGGRVSGSVRAVRTITGFRLVVATANAGLGGIRSIATQCTDASGAWQAIATTSGRLDGRPAERNVGEVTAFIGTTRSCRAVIKSKTVTYTTPTITVSV